MIVVYCHFKNHLTGKASWNGSFEVWFIQDMIRTLVICHPSLFQGGEWLFSYDGLQHLFDFTQPS